MYKNMAVLRYAENFSHNFISETFVELSKLGKIRKACVCGDFGRYNVTPVQNFTKILWKNADKQGFCDRLFFDDYEI